MEWKLWLDFWPEDVRLAVEVRHPDFYQEPHANELDELFTLSCF